MWAVMFTNYMMPFPQGCSLPFMQKVILIILCTAEVRSGTGTGRYKNPAKGKMPGCCVIAQVGIDLSGPTGTRNAVLKTEIRKK